MQPPTRLVLLLRNMFYDAIEMLVSFTNGLSQLSVNYTKLSKWSFSIDRGYDPVPSLPLKSAHCEDKGIGS